jgi:hypothetical protein
MKYSLEIGSFLTGLAAFVTGLVMFFKSKKPTHAKTAIYKALDGNASISEVLISISDRIKDVEFCVIFENTNGGGFPMVTKPTYKRVVSSSDSALLKLFGEKIINDYTSTKMILDSITNGCTETNSIDVKDHALKDFLETENITNLYSVLVLLEENTRVLILTMFLKNNYKLEPKDRTFIRGCVQQVVDIIKKK